MKIKKIKPGQHYKLDPTHFYWSIDLQREVSFRPNKPLVVKATHTIFDPTAGYGAICDISLGMGPDYEGNSEIAFNLDDIISMYSMRPMPLIYLDFVSMFDFASNHDWNKPIDLRKPSSII